MNSNAVVRFYVFLWFLIIIAVNYSELSLQQSSTWNRKISWIKLFEGLALYHGSKVTILKICFMFFYTFVKIAASHFCIKILLIIILLFLFWRCKPESGLDREPAAHSESRWIPAWTLSAWRGRRRGWWGWYRRTQEASRTRQWYRTHCGHNDRFVTFLLLLVGLGCLMTKRKGWDQGWTPKMGKEGRTPPFPL